MKIFGIIDISTIDYPKKCSAVVFMSGCNMKCGYCHNYEHMLENTHEMTPEEVFNSIDLMFAEAIVISGGEPTLQPKALKELCIIAKRKGFPVKLDTNGTNIEIIKDLIDNKLIDYIALDVKCAFDKYKKITNYDGEKIKKNMLELINYCKKNNVFIECRTTFVPNVMDEKDIIEIAKSVKNCDLYTIQQFDNEHAWKDEYKKIREPTTNELVELGKISTQYLKNSDVVVKSKDEMINIAE
ncbi:anaerobic ribonucleoside-triphosphate reductase activating protein [Methanothermococcus okinawensis]|uniref:Anaerobic ribonucleoside-triphosphate reductase activating protein n=1 Tax=Methanothermococcus okinawensis (strain DSM 14208 / JCM 11175 / IH1) TaxID=647113 RepID=F8AKC1_METOI|nr:anaerobic ribonucleoside-triphosphate reductase activating protein [Methanothermococcus okinawensis]AEH06321.1 anaerobic ribonucleoside-triphosphate reductase activating protein [Methanothermococcus okinawensis IH1]